ncbi:hypothetical protein BDZ94DRAFT_1186991 [Collybia nuda]|uniref:DUF6534 domain-containing protein n=1 Tax=Collybia nuda TaxID=64659 RepID=A0A9P5YAY6_9AGAR|nr:hypothetical protein BDZ94DRAFT_1186991 [Collybia nuda]
MFSPTDGIAKRAGPMLLAILVNCGLYGVLCVQIHTYHMAFPTDPIPIKILVYGILVIETAQTVLITKDGFGIFVTDLGDESSLDKIRMFWLSVPIIGLFVAAIGQLFFAHRLRVLSKTWILSITVAILSICAMGATAVIAFRVYHAGKISAGFTDCFVPALVSHLANILCDIEIVISMIYYLLRHKTNISSSRLHQQIKRLIGLVLEAGILTATASILTFLLYIILKDSLYFCVPYVMIPKLYSNTLTFILNNRIKIVGGRHGVETGVGTISLWGDVDMASHRAHAGSSTIGGNIVFCEARSDQPDPDQDEPASMSNVPSDLFHSV